jgi:DNA polymerase III subunit delta
MPGNVHVFDFLEQDGWPVPLGMAVIFGSERFLKRLALKHLLRGVSGEEDLEYAATVMDSENLEWVDVHDELATRSLFANQTPRIVVIDHADTFVRAQRERLEDYLSPARLKPNSKRKTKAEKKPATDPVPEEGKASLAKGRVGKKSEAVLETSSEFTGLLVLVVDSWLSTTRLFKEVEKKGVQIKCDPPLLGKSKNPDQLRIANWLIQRAKDEYQLPLSAAGAQLIIELTDGQFGRMDQELQKLTLYLSATGELALETIRQAVGGWQTNTMWEAIDAATDGDAGKALELLDRLLRGNDHPLAYFGQIASTFRRFSTASEIVFRQLRKGARPNIESALKAAEFPLWNNGLVINEQRLKRIGRKRVQQISKWLVDADQALKRSHSKEEMGRWVLERLLIQIANG